MESTETSRGVKKLIDAGFMFTFHAFSSDSTKRFWRCVIRNCQRRLHTDVNDVIVNRLGHHTHGSDAAGAEVGKIKANTKRRALDGYNGIAVADPQSSRSVRSRTNAKHITTKKLIQRARAQNEAPLPTPKDLALLVVPDKYKFYHAPPDVDELFLLGDSGQANPNRVMIFGPDNDGFGHVTRMSPTKIGEASPASHTHRKASRTPTNDDGGAITSPSWLGPALVWSQQKYQRLLKTVQELRILSGWLPELYQAQLHNTGFL